MANNFIPENLSKINREDWVEFLNVSKTQTPDYAIIGVGITDKSTDYNAEVSEEKWIIERNKRKNIDSYGLSSGVEQTAYKGDPVFDFVDNIRYRLSKGTDTETDLLEVDKYSASSSSTPEYRARKWKVAIEISNNGGDTAKVSYNIHYVGDPIFGTVMFENGSPIFTEEEAEEEN